MRDILVRREKGNDKQGRVKKWGKTNNTNDFKRNYLMRIFFYHHKFSCPTCEGKPENTLNRTQRNEKDSKGS